MTSPDPRTPPGEVSGQEFFGPYYTPAEIAALKDMSVDRVRRLFEKEPGVLIIGRRQATEKIRINKETGRLERVEVQRYRTLRIPEDALKRVFRRISQNEEGR